MTDKEEREAIVRWLREQGEHYWGDGVNIYDDAADAIERGEHHKG